MYRLVHEGYVPLSEEDLSNQYNWRSGTDYYSYGDTKAEIRVDKRGVDYLYFSLGQRFAVSRHLDWCKERSLHDAFNVNDVHHSFISSGCFFNRPKSISALIWSRKPAVHKFNAWYESYVYDKTKKFWYKKTSKGTLTAGRKIFGNLLRDAFNGVERRSLISFNGSEASKCEFGFTSYPSILEGVEDPETIKIISNLATSKNFVANVSHILEGECVS